MKLLPIVHLLTALAAFGAGCTLLYDAGDFTAKRPEDAAVTVTVEAGRFRDDLYYRLAVARISVPPLRSRDGDVELLATHLWNKLSGGTQPFPTDFLARWESYKWPGNVRELYNAIQRRFSLGQSDAWDDGEAEPGPVAGDEHLFDTLLRENVPYTIARRRVLDELDRRFVTVALEKSGGSVARAAASFGIARRYFTKIKSKSK